MPYVYIARCRDGTLYAGWTDDLEKRIRAHNDGKGAKYTYSRRPVTLAYSEEFSSKSDAMRREAAIKKMPRLAKLNLTDGAKNA
ncbi:GIY-YIG domain-containing protein [Synergistales bacterium]|nr:GIY-YIG domain-containing protein [Synergistales bacterium]